MRLSLVMRRFQAVISLAVAAVVTLATLGIAPTPAAVRRALGAGGGEPYPCEVHACGCTSAQDCFTACCCFTPAELAAWRRAQDASAASGERSRTAAAESAPPEAASQATPAADEHCILCEQSDPAPQAAPPQPELPAFALISALTCRAIELSIAWAPPLLAAPPAFALAAAPAVGMYLLAAPPQAVPAPAADVPTPPPKA